MIHILLGLSTSHLQAYPSGFWSLLLLAKPTSQEHISLSNNLQQENMNVSPSALGLITRSFMPLQDFLITTFNLSLIDLCQTHPGMPQICHNFTLRGGTRYSLISLPPASVSCDKGWQSLLPGTPVLLAGLFGLMAT